jgi:predicted Rossmann-fold nucleotide-binding protein
LLGKTLARQNIGLVYGGAKAGLPGGFGILDEVFEMLTGAQLGLHKKRFYFLKNYDSKTIS